MNMVRTVLYVNLTAKTSGAEFSLLSLMAGLDREKFRPLLLLPEGGALKDAAAALGVETVILPSLIRFGEYFHFYKIPKMVRAVFALRKIIRQNGISLVHSNTPRAAYIAGVAAWTCRVPHVTHVRDIGMSPSMLIPGSVLYFVISRMLHNALRAQCREAPSLF